MTSKGVNHLGRVHNTGYVETKDAEKKETVRYIVPAFAPKDAKELRIFNLFAEMAIAWNLADGVGLGTVVVSERTLCLFVGSDSSSGVFGAYHVETTL